MIVRLLHNIGTVQHPNYNTFEEVASCQDKLTFDGVYANVWHNRKALLGKKHKTILFVMWDYVGKDNSFDAIPNKLPIEKFCDWNQIMDLVINYNCELGSHSWTHRDLTLLSCDELINELSPPVPVRYFAYPYGNYNSKVKDAVMGYYAGAFAVDRDLKNDDPFAYPRQYL